LTFECVFVSATTPVEQAATERAVQGEAALVVEVPVNPER
jgi:hypothetical protein